MDIAVNKPAKDYLKKQFDEWYSEKVLKQLEGRDINEIETMALQPIDLSLAALKETSAKWFVGMASYLCDNPQFIVNGFISSGMTEASDGNMEDEDDAESMDELQDDEYDSDTDYDTEEEL